MLHAFPIEGLSGRLLHGFAALFYMTTPSWAVEKVEDVPNYIAMSSMLFFLCVVVEIALLAMESRAKLSKAYNLNGAFGNVAAGMTQQLVQRFLYFGIEMASYIWCYNHFHVFALPWDSPYTWWITFFVVDFCYYWFHRMSHEVNIIWAGHVVHHSSEDYNLTTALRQSSIQGLTSLFFYLPAAICIPPSIMALHRQFNTLYQFWIHTQAIDSLGPLEWVLNTPSHHRVHHGRNRYCIDKNYAGTLIIWDRLFGTFEAEHEEVVYGLTHPLETWDPIWTQLHHLWHVVSTAVCIPTVTARLKTLFYGPGWHDDTPRTGLLEDIPDVHAPMPKFGRSLPTALMCYLFTHWLPITALFILITTERFATHIPYSLSCCAALFIVLTLYSYGVLFNNNPSSFTRAIVIESARLALFLTTDLFLFRTSSAPFASFLSSSPLSPDSFLRPLRIFYLSSLVWILYFNQRIFDAPPKPKIKTH